MGQILGLGVAALAQMKGGNPTPQDQMQVRDMAYKRVPQIRERIFGNNGTKNKMFTYFS